jgi:hypothetical protein
MWKNFSFSTGFSLQLRTLVRMYITCSGRREKKLLNLSHAAEKSLFIDLIYG